MNVTINKNRRTKIYYTVIIILVGVAVVSAAFFSFANGEKKVAFSFSGDDVYEIRNDIFENASVEGGYIILRFQVFLNHHELNYLRITTSSTEPNATVNFEGVDSEGSVVVESFGNPLKKGNTDIYLDNTDFDAAVITFAEMKTNTIEGMQFMESVSKRNLKPAIIAAMIATVIYIVVSFFVITAIKRKMRAA